MKTIATEHSHALAAETNSRSFLKKCLELRKASGQPHSYAFVARASGFKARSFPRDVILGKKSLSAASARALAKGLKLGIALEEYLVALVEAENSEGPMKTADAARSRILGRASAKNRASETVFDDVHFSAVYSALGKPETGATLQEIAKRTSLPLAKIHGTLEGLTAQGLVRVERGRYVGIVNHLAFTEMKKSGAFHRIYLARLETTKARARKNFDSTRALFQESTFSVRLDRLPKLRSELQEILLKFATEAGDDEGDGIASLLVSFLTLNEEKST